MPPETPTSTRATGPFCPLRAVSRLFGVGVLEFALGDLLQGHGQVVLRARLDERRRGVLEADALAELVVVVVDLASPLGSDDHERVARIDVLQQLIDAGMDHGGPWYLRPAAPVGRCPEARSWPGRRPRSRPRSRTRASGRAGA